MYAKGGFIQNAVCGVSPSKTK